MEGILDAFNRHDLDAITAFFALVRCFYEEAWGQGNLAVLDEVLADDYVLRISRLARATRPAADPTTRGTAAMGETIARFRTDFPDLRVTVEALVAEGDTVAVRMTWSGNQRDPLGAFEAPVTGRKLVVKMQMVEGIIPSCSLAIGRREREATTGILRWWLA